MKKLKTSFLTILLSLIIAAGAFAQDSDVREIVIKGTDNMKFDVTLIEARPGETLRITLETKSNMPAQAMAHNLAILDLDTNVDDFVFASMAEPDHEYIAPSYVDRVVAATEMIGGGETSTIEFTVPETPGDYEYVCTFPGHYFGGMRGVLKVSNIVS